jgi:hypothetical protein
MEYREGLIKLLEKQLRSSPQTLLPKIKGNSALQSANYFLPPKHSTQLSSRPRKISNASYDVHHSNTINL